MLIVCPSCASEYEVDPVLLRPNGRKMRCASCREVFFVHPPGEEGEDDDPFDDMALDPDDPVAASLARRMGRDLSVDASSAAVAPDYPPGAIESRKWRGPDLAAIARRVSASARGLPLTLIFAVVLIGGALGALLGRESVVRTAPTTAMLYELAGLPVNLRGLELIEVTSGRGLEEGGEILTVEGVVVNRTDRSHMVPPVSVILRDADGRPLYSWDVQAPRATLHPGENVAFRARLVAPPPEARQVLVRFSPARGVAGAAD
ncbi:MAG: DUF3426 domain-containing protein [Salinarimonadaceae bacterium]|nr:MAG: DUF3426 domain-containing protein [Salinarimonadaceae bacterium]